MARLFLYSMSVPEEGWQALDQLTGKDRSDIRMGVILNAMDIVPGSESWSHGLITSMRQAGYTIDVIDLRQHLIQPVESTFFNKRNVIWVCGGHTYYLRWILARTGADTAIRSFVREGGVYAGWSAGAIVAGPSLHYFDLMGDHPAEAPEVIMDGLGLTDKIIVPHMDHPLFRTGALQVTGKLLSDGRKVLPLRDHEFFVQDK